MTGRMQLLDELLKIGANCARLLALAKIEDFGWRPREDMRSLAELANHLAQIPAVDLKILRGATEQEVLAAERALERPDCAGWQEVLKSGADELHQFMERLSLDEYENNSGTAFYGRTQTNAQWLLEVVTHLYHHRSQLFTYLKLLGYPVNTRTLYE